MMAVSGTVLGFDYGAKRVGIAVGETSTGIANPLGAILMRQFILGLPKDLENAARLDGLSEFGIYWRSVLPLIKPGLPLQARGRAGRRDAHVGHGRIATSRDAHACQAQDRRRRARRRSHPAKLPRPAGGP